MIENYIAQQREEVQPHLTKLYHLLKRLVPEGTTEKLSWGMPTFYFHGNLIHFASSKHHYGIYPGSEPIEVLKDLLVDYKTSKGAIQIPYTKELDEELIKKIVEVCIQRNLPKSRVK